MNTEDKIETLVTSILFRNSLDRIISPRASHFYPEAVNDLFIRLVAIAVLSQRYEEHAAKLLQISPDALSQWYQTHSSQTDAFEQQMMQDLGYTIAPQYLWRNLLFTHQHGDVKSLLSQLTISLEGKSTFTCINPAHHDQFYLMNPQSFNLIFEFLGSIFTTNSFSLSEMIAFYDAMLQSVLAVAKQPSNATPNSIATLMAKLAASHFESLPTPPQSIYDFSCDVGYMLWALYHQLGGLSWQGSCYGQESNIDKYHHIQEYILVHGAKASQFNLHCGDLLRNDWQLLHNDALRFDVIVSRCPFFTNFSKDLGEDIRFRNYAPLPPKWPDWLFLLHGLHHLKPQGVMLTITPISMLWREGEEEQIRRKMIEDNLIDCIIQLPTNIFKSTSISTCIVVTKPQRDPSSKVLFINASKCCERHSILNVMRDSDIARILEAYQRRQDEPGFCYNASREEIAQKGYLLLVPPYVPRLDEINQPTLNEVINQYHKIRQQAESTRAKINEQLRDLGLNEL